MNAPTAGSLLAKPTIDMLAIGDITPSNTHIQELRRSRFDPRLIKELSDSIKSVGVLQAILVRRSQANGRADRFEIVAGERRWLAAKGAGLKEIPATVRELTDEQVLEVQLIENLQREGLHELEEAEGYEELMKLKKISADAVADMVGRSRSYVFKRTKLLALCPEARKAFYAGDLDASKALLIARIGHHDTQRQALKDLVEGRPGWNGRRDGKPMSFREAQQHILEHYMLVLKVAPFELDDAQLVPKAGTCTACPKRTGNQKDLFGDVKNADICTDPKCFDDKRQAHFSVARKRLEEKGKKVISGDAAKKILPNWQETRGSDLHRNEMKGGYVATDSDTYVNGRYQRVKDLLGPDFEPTLIQHPGNGSIIEVATQQAIAAAAGKKKSTSTRAAAKKPKGPKQPDVDDMLLQRLVKLIYEKAPKALGKPHLQLLATRLLHHLNTRTEERAVVAKQFGWSKGMTSGGYYSTAKLPAEALKLDERGLVLLMLELTFLADRYQRRHILEAFGINEEKTRQLIIEERKVAARAAREATKKAKASKKK